MFLYLLDIPLSLHLGYIAAFGWPFCILGICGVLILCSFLAVGGVLSVACQGFLVKEACIGVLVG